MTLVERLQQLVGLGAPDQLGECIHPDQITSAEDGELVAASYVCSLPAYFDAHLIAHLLGKDEVRASQWIAQIAVMPHTMPRQANGAFVGLQYHKATRARWLSWWQSPEHLGGYRILVQRLVDYYLPLARQYSQQLSSGDYADAVQSLNIIYPNLAAARLHAEMTEQWGLVRDLVYAVASYQERVSLWAEQATWARAGMTACERLGDWAGVADMHVLLGNALCHLPAEGDEEPIEQAMMHYRAALELQITGAAPHIGPAANLNLGNAYADLPTGERGANLQQAIACYKAALHTWDSQTSPQAYAMVQNNLGVAYLELGLVGQRKQLQLAVMCFEEALRYRPATSAPLDYAVTENNLGTAYLGLAQTGDAESSRRAVTHLERALEIWTPRLTPRNYAIAVSNLGIAYSMLDTGNVAQNLQDAITCHEEALRYLDPTTDPLQYAKTLSNLGIAYSRYPDGDREENLKKAIECYRDALNVEALPKWNRAGFRHNLLDAYQHRSTLAAALRKGFRRRSGMARGAQPTGADASAMRPTHSSELALRSAHKVPN